MTAPDSVGGLIFDASGLAALVNDNTAALSWLRVARLKQLTVWIPALAVIEVETIRPHTMPVLERLRNGAHEQVIIEACGPSTAAAVDELLTNAEAFDACAGVVIYEARRRGWYTVTADPNRLHRLDPDLPIYSV